MYPNQMNSIVLLAYLLYFVIFILLSKLPTARIRSGPGGRGGSKSGWGGGEGQIAGYFLLRWVTKNMEIRKNY